MVDVIDLTVSPQCDDPLTKSRHQRPRVDRQRDGESKDHNELHEQSTSQTSSTDVFYIDLNPQPLPTLVTKNIKSSEPDIQPLLLPPHISLAESGAVEIITSLPELERGGSDDFIEYLDIDDRKDLPRYFDVQDAQINKSRKILCKTCGMEGDHRSYECKVKICLTCGARNEHTTASCPISKTCFRCGMKGHISANCPNSRADRDQISYDGCDRCGSHIHGTSECPTWWRIYSYVTPAERDRILHFRRQKAGLSIGEGGEGYIAEDPWCHNCGYCGHLGDDCPDVRPDHDREPSAFSNYNLTSGPYFDPDVRQSDYANETERVARQQAAQSLIMEELKGLPDNVGRQGRLKDIDRMKKSQQEAVDEDDTDDWFRKSNTERRNRYHTQEKKLHSSLPQKPKISFTSSLSKANGFNGSPKKPSLLQRLSSAENKESRSGNGKERGKEWRGSSQGRGPQYRGGYSR